MADYIVANDCLFGYPIGKNDGRSITFVVMAVDVPKGGDPLLIDRTTIVDKNKARVANDSDFERFKVRKPSNMVKITESQLNKIVAESIKSALNEYGYDAEIFRNWPDNDEMDKLPQWKKWDKRQEKERRQKMKRNARRAINEDQSQTHEYLEYLVERGHISKAFMELVEMSDLNSTLGDFLSYAAGSRYLA